MNGALWGYGDNIGGGDALIGQRAILLNNSPYSLDIDSNFVATSRFLERVNILLPLVKLPGDTWCVKNIANCELGIRRSRRVSVVNLFLGGLISGPRYYLGTLGHFLAETWKMLQLGSPSSSVFPLIAGR